MQGKLDFPSTERNREAIATVLERFLDTSTDLKILEVASGSGQHVAYFSRRFPHWSFLPSDFDSAHLESIDAYRQEARTVNFAAPRRLDVLKTEWDVPNGLDAIFAINLIHISPWECTHALFSQARRHLKPTGAVYLYGAFFGEGVNAAPSNLAFDEGLRRRNPAWGVRRLEEVDAVARSHNFHQERLEEMPANNLSVLWRLSSV